MTTRILTESEQVYLNYLHKGDYLPSDISKMTGINEDALIKVLGNFERKVYYDVIITEDEYNSFIWFKEEIRTTDNYYNMGKPSYVPTIEPELTGRKLGTSFYEFTDMHSNVYHVIKASVDPDSATKSGWNVYVVRDGVSEEWTTDNATKNDCMDAIKRYAKALSSEQIKAETIADNAPIKPKKTIVCTCEYCGIEYQAERKSSRFCSDVHRVAWNRAEKRKKKLAENDIFAQVRKIGALVNEPIEAYQATVTLINLKKAIEFYTGTLTRYWKCNNCGTAVMAFLPDETYCTCGKDANWFIVAKKG